MANQRKRLEKALHGCAEAGVPDTLDLWPAVKERATGERASAEPLGHGESNANLRRRFRFPRLVPNTPLGWVLAAVSVLIIGVGVYAAAGPVREIYRQGSPGTVEPGAKKRGNDQQAADEKEASSQLFQYEVSGVEGSDLGTTGQIKTAGGATVTLERAYADEEVVVIAYSVHDSTKDKEKRGVGLLNEGFQPVSVVDWDKGATSAPDYSVDLTDGSGQDFALVGGGMQGVRRSSGQVEGYVEVFKVPDGLEASRAHQFRFEVPLSKGFPPSKDKEPDLGPLVFEFEIPVRPVSVVEVDQEKTVNGVTLTLDHVIDSPGRPEAEICVDPPDNKHWWVPSLRGGGAPMDEPIPPKQPNDNCWTLTLSGPLEEHSSVTVTELDGLGRMVDGEGPFGSKTIQGPWTFEFDAPAR